MRRQARCRRKSRLSKTAGVKLYTDEKNAAELAKAAGRDKTLAGYLKAHLSRIKAGDYFAVLGYIQMNAEHERSLQAMRQAVRDKKHVATCLGFGPRFLHSTGQAYKGGPNPECSCRLLAMMRSNCRCRDRNTPSAS